MAPVSLMLSSFDSDDAYREALVVVTLDTRESVQNMIWFSNGTAYTDASYNTQLTFTDMLRPDETVFSVAGTELHSSVLTAGAQAVTVFKPVGVLYWTDDNDDDGLSTWNRRLVLAYKNSLSDFGSFTIEGLTVQSDENVYQDLLRRSRALGTYE